MSRHFSDEHPRDRFVITARVADGAVEQLNVMSQSVEGGSCWHCSQIVQGDRQMGAVRPVLVRKSASLELTDQLRDLGVR